MPLPYSTDLFQMVRQVGSHVLTAVFCAAGAAKISASYQFDQTIRSFPGFRAISPVLITVIPYAEILLGLTLLIHTYYFVLLIIGSFLLIFSTAAVYVVYKNISVSCSCFGSTSEALGWVTVHRNTYLMLIVGIELIRPEEPSRSLIWTFESWLLSAVAILLYLAAKQQLHGAVEHSGQV